jgi:hypothetical protein
MFGAKLSASDGLAGTALTEAKTNAEIPARVKHSICIE